MKKISSKLQIHSSIENIMKINEKTICTYSGLLSNAMALIEMGKKFYCEICVISWNFIF